MAGRETKETLVAQRLRKELEDWHRNRPFDLVAMFEEQPDLFRALLKKPSLFEDNLIGEKYCRLIKSTSELAQKSKLYKDAFFSSREASHFKDALSIGKPIDKDIRKKRS